MKKITIAIFIALAITHLSFSQEVYKRVTVNTSNDETLHKLINQGVDLRCGAIHGEEKVTLELSQSELDLLNINGVYFNVEIDDLSKFYNDRIKKTYSRALVDLEREKAKTRALRSSTSSTTLDNFLEYTGINEVDWAVPTNFNLGTMGGCLTISEMEAELDQMYSLYPNLISPKQDASATNKTTWGNPASSITNNGLTYSGQGTTRWNPKTVYYVRITGSENTTPEGTRPQSLYTSMIHAREVGSLMSNIYFMWYLLENYDTDPAIKNLVDNNELYFIPVVNPDGLRWNEHVNSSGGAMQRKNLRPNTGGTGNTSTNRGVDLNRNFDYFWGTAGSGSSGTQTDDSYRGTSAFSEPESQILRDFVLARNFETCIMNHTSANGIPHPYGGNPTFVSGRENEMHKWHEDMTRYNRYISGATIFSAANGIADDWMVGGNTDGNGKVGSGQNILASTPEHGSTGFWPPTNDIVPIAKRSMRISLMTTYYGGKYAKFHDLTQSDISTLTPNLKFGIERLGQTASDFTLTVTPISSNITSIASIPTETGMTALEQRELTAGMVLDGSIQANDKIEYRVQLANGDGIVFYDVNFEKYYQPTALLADNPDSDLLTNWSTSGTWTASNATEAPYSGTRAIKLGTNAISAYGNNDSRTLTTASSYDFSNASEVLIQFFSKWDLERNFDFVEILGSTNGSTWQSLNGKYNKPNSTTSTNNAHEAKGSSSYSFQSNNSSGRVYDGDQMDKWVMEEIVIDATNNSFLYGASTAYIRFKFASDTNNRSENYSTTSEGFFIDDFKILQIQIPCDASNPPTGLTVNTITPASVSISWDNVPSATYDVRYRKIGDPTWIESTDIALTSFNITGLTASTNYEVQVNTRCTGTTSSYSSSVNFTTTASAACTGTEITSYPYLETFDSGIADWTHDGSDDGEWTLDASGTPSSTTGPSDDYNVGGNYFYTEATTSANPGPNAIVNLISPCFNLSGFENASISFYYHMYGGDMGDLLLDITVDNGATWINLVTISGQQHSSNGDSWSLQNVNLDLYAGQTVKFRFQGQTGSNYRSDMAFDNVNVIATNTYYEDLDVDGYGDPNSTLDAVTQPAGFVVDNTDCDDTLSIGFGINPGATEILDNDVDEDCDGIMEYSLSNDEFNLNNISIVPNPFINTIEIILPSNVYGTYNVSVYDLNGRLIYNKNENNISGRISISALNEIATGSYLLRLTEKNTGTTIIKKLIKQ